MRLATLVLFAIGGIVAFAAMEDTSWMAHAPLTDPRWFVQAIYMTAIRSVFPETVDALIEEYRLLRIELKMRARVSPKTLLRKLSRMKSDTEFRYFLLERSKPSRLLKMRAACAWYFNRLMHLDPNSEAFKRESGLLVGAPMALTFCQCGLEMMNVEDWRNADEGTPDFDE